MTNEILKFITDFRRFDKDNTIIKTFTEGYCYYFAIILQERFGGQILYDPIAGHFITFINNKYYDITGDITEIYKNNTNLYDKTIWMSSESIIRDVILKTERT